MIPNIPITEHIFLPTWMLILSLNMSLCLVWVNLRASSWGLSRSQALDLGLFMMIGAVIGGRLLHVAYESPEFYIRHPFSIFMFWQGGFVFYGGLLGAMIVGWRWCVAHDQSIWRWGDFFAPVMAGAYAIGRIGCFFNGCCYGSACFLPWGMTFHSHAAFGIEVLPRHPTQLYATIWELGVLGYLLWREKRPSTNGALFLTWLFLHGLGRVVMETFRDDDRGPLLGGVSLGTLISLAIMISAVRAYRLREKSISN